MLAKLFEGFLTQAVKNVYGVQPDLSIVVQPPTRQGMGHLTSNFAFQLGKLVGESPTDVVLKINKELKSNLSTFDFYAESYCESKGHWNIILSQNAFSQSLWTLRHVAWISANQTLAGSDISLEFVSANPTGPLSVVNGRAGVLGDSLAKIFAMSGALVRTHYYINDNPDSGQIIALKNTFDHYDKLKAGELSEFPEDGYKGECIKQVWDYYDMMIGGASQTHAFLHYGIGRLAQQQVDDLKDFGIHYSDITLESQVIKKLTINEAFTYFGKKLEDYTYELDGAVWLKTSEYGDDKDRVITREDGRNTYFHNDIIYHACKLLPIDNARLINILGADHHGYLPRLNAVMRMWGRKDVETILTQMVSLEIEENGETVVFMGSKREGQYLLLKDDFVDKVGNDAARWYFLSGDPQSAITINVKKATEQNMSNPVFYVQYAHARLCSIIQKSYDVDVDASQTYVNLDLNNSMIAHELILKLDGYNRVVQRSALTSSVQPLKIYLYELAQMIHSFYEHEKIIDQPLDKWLAGLYLINGATKVLRDGLELLGISAPEVMRKES